VGDWKLIEFFEEGELELYNLREDLSERNNLAAKMPEKTKELHASMLKWRKATKAPVPTEKNPQYNPKAKYAPRNPKAKR
jgi:arylsulfatase A-like enzyme